MKVDPINTLRSYQDEPNLGAIAKQALQFIGGAQSRVLQSPGPGQSSLAVVRMYEIRKSQRKFQQSAFIGLDESIKSLRKRDVNVHLSAIETERGVVSLWLTDELSPPVSIVIARFEP
jgi:hypothetical protein